MTTHQFKRILKYMDLNGREVSPRGQLTKELQAYTYVLRPYVRFMNFPSRKLKINYIKREFLWYLKGDQYDLSICDHATMWKSMVNEYYGNINSNYGRYIFAEGQYWLTVKSLLNDKDTRRAAIVILNRGHLSMKTNDVPCTYAISFNVRNNKLNMFVKMRSQDLIYGACNDIPCFSFLHEMLYVNLRDAELTDDYTGQVKWDTSRLEMGKYYHYCDSLHVYEKHFDMFNNMLKEEIIPVYCPKIFNIHEVKYLQVLHTKNYNEIPDDYKFTKWLTTFDL